MALSLTSDITLDTADRLRLRGLQTDPHGEVLGGHTAIFDFASLSLDLSADEEIENAVYDGDPCLTTIDISDVVANKGVEFPASGVRRLLCGDLLKPSSLGAAPSYVMAFWLTRTGAAPYGGIAGAADANAEASREFRLFMDGGGDDVICHISDGGTGDAEVLAPLALNVPQLLTVFVEKGSESSYTMRVYVDGVLIGVDTGAYYGYTSTAESMMGGFGAGSSGPFSGIFHRAQMLQVDPDIFNITEWNASEIASNSARFA